MSTREVRKRRDEYLLASLDPNFLLGDSTRGIRFFLEYESLKSATGGGSGIMEAANRGAGDSGIPGQ
jgi:hypothetical protein